MKLHKELVSSLKERVETQRKTTIKEDEALGRGCVDGIPTFEYSNYVLARKSLVRGNVANESTWSTTADATPLIFPKFSKVDEPFMPDFVFDVKFPLNSKGEDVLALRAEKEQ